MSALRLDRLLETLFSQHFLLGVLWGGLAALTVTLLVMMRTRWGQTRPLMKCTTLSILAHLLLLCYAATVHITASPIRAPKDAPVSVTLGETLEESAAEASAPAAAQPWEVLPNDALETPDVASPAEASADSSQERAAADAPPLAADLAPVAPQVDAPPPQPTELNPAELVTETVPAESEETVEVAAAQQQTAPQTEAPATQMVPEAVVDESPLTPLPTQPSEIVLPPAAVLPPLAAIPAPPRPSALDLSSAPDQPLERLPAESPEESSLLDPLAPLPEAPTSPIGRSPTGIADAIERGAAPTADMESSLAAGLAAAAPLALVPRRGTGRSSETPELFSLRTAPDRSSLIQQQGGSADTEAAVRAALVWISENQSPDGRWDASLHEAGREGQVLGRNRQGAGANADTGVTGLALLAFLGAGHTHLEGDYTTTVARGLDYLIATQDSSGHMAGRAETFAFMYCHAMATMALSEAYAMTGDPQLYAPLRKAVAYTINAQHGPTGGWRYKPNNPGDTSILGWQIMALKSAELAGLDVPKRTRDGAIRYLQSVASGRHGGLAAYRPQEVGRPSLSMTAEALACRQFLGISREHPSCNEAGDALLQELPGDGDPNYYYWYYGTLSMFQLQGDYWRQWNDALTKTLLESQAQSGPGRGSWEPNDVWGSHGGRVYSTALATLCLEVYYRFLPLYVETAAQEASSN